MCVILVFCIVFVGCTDLGWLAFGLVIVFAGYGLLLLWCIFVNLCFGVSGVRALWCGCLFCDCRVCLIAAFWICLLACLVVGYLVVLSSSVGLVVEFGVGVLIVLRTTCVPGCTLVVWVGLCS